MDNVKGSLIITARIPFTDFSGKARVKVVTLAQEHMVTQQQAKGYAADWRGMNGGEAVIQWKPYPVHL